MVLPDGMVLPPIPYLGGLIVATILVAAGIYRVRPRIRHRTIIALVPWMAAGGAFHVLAVAGIVTGPTSHLFEAPAVYLSTGVIAGIAWLVALREPVGLATPREPALVLGSLGVIAVGVPSLVVIGEALAMGTFAPRWAALGLLGSVGASAVVWYLLARLLPGVVAATGWTGFVLVFGHVFDGVTTTIGIDLLGQVERSPLPRLIMDVAAQLPTAPLLGTGWLFVLVKVAISVAILWLFTPFARDDPEEAFALLGLLAAVGLGPGAHNLLLAILGG